ncbi:MFS transporter [Streptomyces cyaneochromogenes]|uniref:MFS transporter n=1 Tax=Streptomyces cyaneochromogenes TaxID=2496836 RepID=A0A3Q9EYC2_9ACTN|nr:MFS transporter [Streptomyces cyaneochromogenes]AZQ38566.1 MFS transporter [Streptomyces cyaneochromogenes]
MTTPLHTPVPRRSVFRSPLAPARRAVATVFAAQGAAVAAVSTTVPAVQERLSLSSLTMTVLVVAVALSAGVGSFAGLAVIRRLGLVTTMRIAVVATAVALLLIGWAPDQAVAAVAYGLFGMALGCIDVSANTRAAAVERHYGRSIFASFYAAWSAAGVTAALLTAGTADLGWPAEYTLTVQAGLILALALTVRSHTLPAESPIAVSGHGESVVLGRGLWVRLAPFGLVLLVAYVIDSTVSSWSTLYLHQTLDTSLSLAPLAYAAYQVGTVTGRACADHLVRRMGPAAVVRAATLLTAAALAGLAAAPAWPYAVLAAACTGLGVSALVPLCLASAGRLRPGAAEAVLARMNVFNYTGVLAGGAASGVLGSTGHFRLAYAIPAVLVLALLTTARSFDRRSTS